jgi:hypothetical protein
MALGAEVPLSSLYIDWWVDWRVDWRLKRRTWCFVPPVAAQQEFVDQQNHNRKGIVETWGRGLRRTSLTERWYGGPRKPGSHPSKYQKQIPGHKVLEIFQ